MYNVVSVTVCAQHPSMGRWFCLQDDAEYQHGLSCSLASLPTSRGGIYYIWASSSLRAESQVSREGVGY